MDEQITPQFNTIESQQPPVPQLLSPEDQKYLSGWSWAACMMSFVWGIGNRVWIAIILPFLPLIGFILLGLKGRKWAWETERWESFSHFKASQKTWDFAGMILFILAVTVIVFWIMMLVIFLS